MIEGRPNSMNNYGVIVNQIGMRPLIDDLQRKCLLPLTKLLFPKQGSRFDKHHSFMVKYKSGEDRGLDMHHDDSDVTLNVCLGREFTGATLSFCGGFGAADHRRHVGRVSWWARGRLAARCGPARPESTHQSVCTRRRPQARLVTADRRPRPS